MIKRYLIEDFNFLAKISQYVRKQQEHFLHTFENFQEGEVGVVLDVSYSNSSVHYTYYWADDPSDKESPYVGKITIEEFLNWYN